MTPLRIICLALGVAVMPQAEAATVVIPVNYRTADEVLSVAQSVVGDNGRVSAYGNQLVVNAPDAVVGELRSVIEQIDTAPRRLLISLDTQQGSSSHTQGYQFQGGAGSGSGAVELGDGRGGVRIIQHRSQGDDAGIQQVLATEGYPALIQIGESVPLTQWSTDGYGQVYQDTHYRDLMRGFYATANVIGDRVQVSISMTNDRADTGPGVAKLQSADTRLSGPLGEWIPLGGVDQSYTAEGHGIARRYSTDSATSQSFRIKVDLVE